MPPKHARRTPEERIAALKAQIDQIKARARQQKIKKDPALRHISGAIRSIDKALAETEDKPMRTALSDVRASLSACLTLSGAVPSSGSETLIPRASHVVRPEPDAVLDYIREHPGSHSGQICRELATDAPRLRPVLHQLRDEGKLLVEGKARATRYSVK